MRAHYSPGCSPEASKNHYQKRMQRLMACARMVPCPDLWREGYVDFTKHELIIIAAALEVVIGLAEITPIKPGFMRQVRALQQKVLEVAARTPA
jgi:hypothetical protein